MGSIGLSLKMVFMVIGPLVANLLLSGLLLNNKCGKYGEGRLRPNPQVTYQNVSGGKGLN